MKLRSALSVALALSFGCAPPPHAILEVQDPLGLAAAGDGVRLNEGELIGLAGNDFPLRVTVTARREEAERRVEVEVFDGGLVIARGFAIVGFAAGETNTFNVVLGSPCDVSANGTSCQLADGSGPGLCLSGRCGPSFCPDGFVDEGAGEECDDGNASAEDSCLPNCVLNVCGDGIVNPAAEACDDGNDEDGDACLSSCEAPRCGDGIVQAGVEACDDGDDDDTDGCPSTCQTARCGDGFVLAGVEACDDGNDDNTDACVEGCVVASCGDGFVFTAGGEACDDGNDDDGDACPGNCEEARCGDGFVFTAGGEACDDENNTDGDDCLGVCQPNVCGDGIVNVAAGDDCDDGNALSRDGCSSTCRFTIWEADLGDAAGANTIIQVDVIQSIEQIQEGEIPLTLDAFAATTAAGHLVALSADDGGELFRYDAGAPIVGGLSQDAGRFTFLTEDGRLHYVGTDGTGASATLPGGATPVTPYASQVILADGVNLSGLVVGDDLRVYDVAPPQGFGCAGPAPCPAVFVDLSTLDPPPVPCPDRACAPTLQFPVMHIPMLGELLVIERACAPNAVHRYPLDDPNDYIVGHPAFLGDGDQDYDEEDLLVAVTASGALYRFQLFPALVGSGPVCGVAPATTTPTRLASELVNIIDEPVLAPVGGTTVILTDREGKLHKRVGESLDADNFNELWVSDQPATLAHTPAADAEGFLYFGDSTARLHKVHMISGAAAFTQQLPARVVGSPLVGRGVVFVLLEDGRVQALERGGSRMPRYAAWHRHGGSSDGIATAQCGATGSAPFYAFLLLIALARFRRTILKP